MLDRYLAEALTDEEYEQFWSKLAEKGHVCVVITDGQLVSFTIPNSAK